MRRCHAACETVTDFSQREKVWVLLSELFVDTELGEDDLRGIGEMLAKEGISASEAEQILHDDVAPVCGRWMIFGAAVGPWPAFDEASLKRAIAHHAKPGWQPWRRAVRALAWWALPGIRRDWQMVRNAMPNLPSPIILGESGAQYSGERTQ